jgi:hypothetical protein
MDFGDWLDTGLAWCIHIVGSIPQPEQMEIDIFCEKLRGMMNVIVIR